jgi:cyclophilin family peptidyl-prolyl cis-trans isomerase
MKTFISNAAMLILLLPSFLAAQAPSVSVGSQKPSLKRDRTQRILYPKIVEMEDERTVTGELLDMLTQSHGGVRRRAILALGRIGYGTGVTSLIEVLKDGRSSPEMRALAVFSLGEIENHFAVAALLDRIQPANESSLMVRARAVEALGKIASNKFSADTLGKYALASIADMLARTLPATSQTPTVDQKFLASKTLTALLRLKQPATVEAIAAGLRSPDSDLRWQAANALARLREGIAVAVPALVELLGDKEWLVRAHAARALGVAKDKRAVEPLIKLLGDTEERVVVTAINSLGSVEDPRAVEPLLALATRQLEGYRSFNRAAGGVPTQQNQLLLIATALGNLKDPRALPLLKAFRLADGRVGSHPEAEIAVAKFGEAAFFDAPAGANLPKDDWKAMAAYAQGLGQLGSERAKTILLDLLSGKTYGKPDARAVSDILNALAASKYAGIKDLLFEQLKAEDVIVRTTAATLLGDLGDSSEQAVKAFHDAYKAARADRMNDARVAILEALHKLKRPMNIQALSGDTRDMDYVVRLKAVELLRQSDEEVPLTKLQIGAAETGHDRAYWKRVSQLQTSTQNPVAIIHTKKGPIRIELLASDAPMTVDNFIQLSRSGFYDGLTFMRVVPNFVIQGGDPRDDMNGGPGYQIRCEINYHEYGVGAVGMALSGKDTGGSQFFITHSPQPHLDGGYTVFGQVVEGMDVVNRIARGDRIERVEIPEAKK